MRISTAQLYAIRSDFPPISPKLDARVPAFPKCEGYMWAGLWAWSLYDLGQRVRCYRAITLENLPPEEKQGKLRQQAKEVGVQVINVAGVSAIFTRWAHASRLISVERFLPLLQKISYGSFLLTSGFYIEKTITSLKKAWSALQQAATPEAKEKHRQEYCLAWMDLAAHISTLAWAMLGVIELAAGIAVSPLLMTSVFMAGCVFALASIGYGTYIDVKPA
ncbi:MAG TPA: hypothetical protein VGJ00_07120 [Rhabdochlamydiaceae bacterium]|jgi:hypothetical protein